MKLENAKKIFSASEKVSKIIPFVRKHFSLNEEGLFFKRIFLGKDNEAARQFLDIIEPSWIQNAQQYAKFFIWPQNIEIVFESNDDKEETVKNCTVINLGTEKASREISWLHELVLLSGCPIGKYQTAYTVEKTLKKDFFPFSDTISPISIVSHQTKISLKDLFAEKTKTINEELKAIEYEESFWHLLADEKRLEKKRILWNIYGERNVEVLHGVAGDNYATMYVDVSLYPKNIWLTRQDMRELYILLHDPDQGKAAYNEAQRLAAQGMVFYDDQFEPFDWAVFKDVSKIAV